ncbi:MAG TPA: PEGA domain-containing protein [Ignavibacteriaceae bacterium]|nr:PEGA domain-containing protein [Ignavibacteriaceae bacterium]
MKKLLLIPALLLFGLLITSCDEETTSPETSGTNKGSIFVSSTPTGAQIWVNGSNTGKITPDTVKNLDSGFVNITLKLTNYKDTTFSREILPNFTSSVFIQMSQPPIYEVSYSNIQLYEQASSSFSGLNLATGARVNSSAADADIFLETVELKSQDQRTPSVSNPRVTYFNNSPASTNLLDGVASSIFSSATWGKSKSRSATTYSFLYTKDGNYVKLKCVNYGGATGPSDPDRWVVVSYKYNQTVGDTRFTTN